MMCEPCRNAGRLLHLYQEAGIENVKVTQRELAVLHAQCPAVAGHPTACTCQHATSTVLAGGGGARAEQG